MELMKLPLWLKDADRMRFSTSASHDGVILLQLGSLFQYPNFADAGHFLMFESTRMKCEVFSSFGMVLCKERNTGRQDWECY